MTSTGADRLFAIVGRLSLLADPVRPLLLKLKGAARGSTDGFDKTGLVAGAQAIDIIALGGVRYPVYESIAHSFWRAQELTLFARRAARLAEPVLDFGCGDGSFAKAAFGHLGLAVDNDPEAAQAAAASGVYDRVVTDIAEVHDATVGTVVSNSVLEHVGDLDGALTAIRRVLRPGGQLVFTVPTRDYTDHLAFYFGQRACEQINRESAHQNLLDVDSWRVRLAARGLRVEETISYQPPRFTYWYRMLRLLGPRALGAVVPDIHRRWLARRRGWLERTILDSIDGGRPVGANVFIVARRD
jgi:SAM-dependent methyltransferase